MKNPAPIKGQGVTTTNQTESHQLFFFDLRGRSLGRSGFICRDNLNAGGCLGIASLLRGSIIKIDSKVGLIFVLCALVGKNHHIQLALAAKLIAELDVTRKILLILTFALP